MKVGCGFERHRIVFMVWKCFLFKSLYVLLLGPSKSDDICSMQTVWSFTEISLACWVSKSDLWRIINLPLFSTEVTWSQELHRSVKFNTLITSLAWKIASWEEWLHSTIHTFPPLFGSIQALFVLFYLHIFC